MRHFLAFHPLLAATAVAVLALVVIATFLPTV